MNLVKKMDNEIKKIVERHAQTVEEIIKRLIVDNDCKPSDVLITIKGHMCYEFHVKKHELKTEINYKWSPDDN